VRRRLPPFPLVLSALVAGVILVVLLVNGNPGAPSPPPTIGIGSSRACVSARAKTQVTARSAVVVTATVNAPVAVTQSARGPGGAATATRSEVVTARDKVTRPVAVKRAVAARATACARAGSSTAADEAALRRAHARALINAHVTAARQAEGALRALQHWLFPSVLAQARSRAAARAHELAVAAEPALAAQARALARRKAGA